MKVYYPGHRYRLEHLDGNGGTLLNFVQRKPHHDPREGVTNQEVLRVLIDRVLVLDSELPWEGNKKILKHLRLALVLHESRAIERKVEKDEMCPEKIRLDVDGHFALEGIK